MEAPITGKSESLRRCIKTVREAYNLTNDEVEYLYRRWKNGSSGEAIKNASITEEDESSAKWSHLARVLAKKLDLEEALGGDPTKYGQKKEFYAYANWLFAGEDVELIANKPDVIQCPEYPHGCGLMYERSAFPYWPTDKRCNTCIRKACHPQKGLSARRVAVKNLHQLVSIGDSAAIDRDFDRFVRVFSRFIAKEGSIEGVADHWHNWFEAMRADPKGCKSATLGRAYLSIMKIWLEIDKHRDQQNNFADMKDEQLKEFIVQQMVSRMSREQVENFIEAATQDLPILERLGEEEVHAEAAYLATL
jgi:hypothetical protein